MRYAVANRMVMVDFHDCPLPFPTQTLAAQLFVARECTFTREGEWVGIVCMEQEWMDFLDSLVVGLSYLSERETSTAVAAWRSEYIQFLAQVRQGPFLVQ